MSVKSIFKILIGTIVVIVMTSVIIELFNINTTGVMLHQYIQLSADQSCELYTQETYRKGSTAGATSETQLYAADGTSYSGGSAGNFHQFYGAPGLTEKAIWQNIYGKPNAEFKTEMSRLYADMVSHISGTYPGGSIESLFPEMESLKLMADSNGVLYTGANVTYSGDIWNAVETDPDYIKYLNYNRANNYIKNMYTPVNIGIPYIDKNVTNKIFRWNLTQMLSNCNSGNILKDENGDYYVNFKGFAVYTQKASITKLQYHICDLNTSEGKNKLKNLTGINGNNLKIKNLGTPAQIVAGNKKVSNNIVVVVEVDYSVPVTYRGITPIKEVFNYFMNRNTKRVAGRDGDLDAITKETYEVDDSQIFRSENSNGGKLSIGKLYYTLVR